MRTGLSCTVLPNDGLNGRSFVMIQRTSQLGRSAGGMCPQSPSLIMTTRSKSVPSFLGSSEKNWSKTVHPRPTTFVRRRSVAFVIRAVEVAAKDVVRGDCDQARLVTLTGEGHIGRTAAPPPA